MAEIVFTIGGTWDAAGFGEYSFWGELFVKADGSWPRIWIDSEQDTVWFDKFYPGIPPLPLLPYRPTIPTRTTRPELKRGSQGDAVRQVQQLLNRWGASAQPPVALDADGKFGKDTEKVVKAFQRSGNLDVDGVVGTRTWQALLAFK